jgi:hypothetical protein
VTGVPEDFHGLPAGTRAGQLPSPELGGHFLKVFGQPSRETVCDCERGKEPKLTQPLTLLNGTLISQKLRDRRGKLSAHVDQLADRLAAAGQPPSSGRVLWLKADDGPQNESGQTAASGAFVAKWLDKSGSGRNAVQTTSGQQPILVDSAIGGLPAVRFDGSDDWLTNTTDDLAASGRPRTILAVGRVAKEGRGGALISFRRTTSDGGTVFAAQHINLGGIYYVYSDGVNGAGNSTLPIDRFRSLHEPFVTSFVSRGTGNKLLVTVNGQDQPVSQPGAIGPDAGAAGFTIGSREDIPPGAQCWAGDLAEILVYDRELSADDLKGAGAYLATKYALTADYPRRSTPVAADTAGSLIEKDRAFLADLYFAAFSRPASEEELTIALDYIQAAADRRQGLEDVSWAVLNAKEFLFQH